MVNITTEFKSPVRQLAATCYILMGGCGVMVPFNSKTRRPAGALHWVYLCRPDQYPPQSVSIFTQLIHKLGDHGPIESMSPLDGSKRLKPILER